MITIYIIASILLLIIVSGLIFYLKYLVPLRPKEPGFEYVYVKEDGSVRELDDEDVEYLKEKFHPADGARPYIKTRYDEMTTDKNISGFILRRRVHKKITIAPPEQVKYKMKEKKD